MTIIEAIKSRLAFRRPRWGDSWIRLDDSQSHYFVDDESGDQVGLGEVTDIMADDYETRACHHPYKAIQWPSGTSVCSRCGEETT